MFYAGVARTDIMPPLGIAHAGWGAQTHQRAIGVDLPLWATALALNDDLAARVRRVGYVPMPHHSTETPLEELEGAGHIPGYVPDPLLPDPTVHAGPHETHAFWITVHVPPDMPPGSYAVDVTVAAAGEQAVTLTATVVVHQAALRQRRDFPSPLICYLAKTKLPMTLFVRYRSEV